MNNSKRKANLKPQGSRKEPKVEHSSLRTLPWKCVHRPSEAGQGGDDGIIELEEIDDVEVVYEETEAGRVAKFVQIVRDRPSSATENEASAIKGELEDIRKSDVSQPDVLRSEEIDQVFEAESLLPEWHRFSLHPRLLKALHHLKFNTPTPIQSEAIPKALEGRDVVGIAETGSGKTLAYGLPILHYLFSQPQPVATAKRKLKALVLAPTRELALQVSSHLNQCLNDILEPEEGDTFITGSKRAKDKEKAIINPSPKSRPPRVSVAAIVGGMSPQKQRRILDRGVDVLVATPGRLWDLLEENDKLSKEIKNLRFLVLDEADRMVEAGHFAELENILRLTLRQDVDDQIAPDFDDGDAPELEGGVKASESLQTFVFSATLSKDLQQNLKRRSRPKLLKKGKRDEKPATTLDDLLFRLDFRDSEPEIIDISPVGGVVSTLRESRIECLASDKDVYLYYFLLRHPGRSLVFLSSIDGLRRLMPLTEALNLKAFPLHSQLEQRQRLKNLDRFKSTPSSILLATDIAARGLDIPAVDHVIHYQLPRTADAYVHRNGRTARAQRKGFSMMMCSPEEKKIARALFSSLGRHEKDVPEMAIDLSLLDKLKARVQLARQIEQAQHKVKKENHERNWIKETAAAMELELDSDFASDEGDGDKPLSQKRKAKKIKTASMKSQLKEMLAQPLIARGISTKYITSGSVPVANELLNGNYNEAMVGFKAVDAGSAVLAPKKRRQKSVSYDEWNGIEK